MTPTEYQTVRATIVRIWPRVAQRMTDTDWKIISQRCVSLNVSPEQAEAALEELRATDDKYPSPAKIIACLRRLEPRHIRTATAAVEESTGPRHRLWQMREGLGFDGSVSDAQIVLHWYAAAAHRSIRLRGYVRESLWTHMHADLIELGHYDPASADEAIVRAAERFPHEPPAGADMTKQQAWYADMVKRNPTLDPDYFARRWGRDHNARPQPDKTQRQDVCDELAEINTEAAA